MQIKHLLLSVLALMPFSSYAEKGNFEFSGGAQKNIFNASCVKSISYLSQDETGSGSLHFQFSDSCGKRLLKMTHENIGKKLTFSYSGNELFTGLIVQQLNSNFRISTKNTPKVIVMQVINDYRVKVQ